MSQSRKRLKNLLINEVSVVDNPANPGAQVALFKRGASMASNYGGMSDEEKSRMKELEAKGMSPDKARSQVMREMRKEDDQGGKNMDVEQLKERLEKVEADLKSAIERGDTLQTQFDAVLAQAKEIGLEVNKADDGNVTIAKAADPEYVEINGEKVEKSAVPAPVLAAIEKQTKEIADLKSAQEREELQKRAENLFPNLAGTPDQKALLVKSLDGIEAEDDRKALSEALNAADKAVGELFKSVGSNSVDENSPEEQLNKMARDYAAEHNVTFEVGYSEVTKSGEGRKLFAKTRS